MEEFVDFIINDEKIVRKYTNYVLNNMNNGLQDLRERDTNFSDELFGREINLLKDIKANFRLYCKDISEEEVKRLSNLIEIYCCLKV